MQKMFHGKFATVQLVVKIQIVTIDVNVVDINATTRNKAIEEHVFKDKKSRRAKSVAD